MLDRLTAAGVVRPAADPSVRAAFLMINDLAALLLRDHVTAVLGVEPLTPERLDLDPSRPFGTLSKGNRQKVGIVQALCHDPQVIILDEPTTGLDPLVQREFLALLGRAAGHGAAILFSSHVLPEVERAADRVAIIRAGRLVTVATVDALLDQARRRLELRFAAPIPTSTFDDIAGIANAEVHDRTALLAIDGPVGPALRAATEAGTLLRVNPAGDDLEDLFVSLYHQDKDASKDRIEV